MTAMETGWSDEDQEDHDSSNHLERQPTDPRRLRNFATFFKNYMSVSAIVAAAAPIPVALFDLIPQYDSLRRLTTTLSSLLAFLTLAYIFFNRSALGRAWFGGYLLKDVGTAGVNRVSTQLALRMVGLLPLFLILLSLASLLLYLWTLQLPLEHLAWPATPSRALASLQFGQIPNSAALMMSLIGFFVLAEAAFIVMALREYTQDLLGITDLELIRNVTARAGKDDAIVKNAAHLVVNGSAKISQRSGSWIIIRDLRHEYDYVLNRQAFESALVDEQKEERSEADASEAILVDTERDATVEQASTQIRPDHVGNE